MNIQKRINIDKNEIFSWCCIAILGTFFFFFLGEKGTILCKDSTQYLQYTNFNSVMPTYPLFLLLLKYIFGEILYMDYVFIFQGILAFVSSLFVTKTLQKIYHLKSIEIILVFVFTLAPYAYTLPEHVSSHEVMTESLAFPIFYLWFITILKSFLTRKLKYIINSSILLVILISLRAQLLLLLLVYAFLMFYFVKIAVKHNERMKRIFKKILILFLLVIFTIGVMFGVRQKIAETNSEENASQLVNAFLGKMLYLSEKNDAEYFESEEMKEIFQQLYSRIDDKRQRLQYSDRGLLLWDDISYCANDNMKIGIDVIYFYYREKKPDLSYYEIMPLSEVAKTEIVKTLFIHKLGDLIYIYLWMLPSGFLSMVFIQKRSIYTLCTLYGALFYIFYLLVLYYSYKKDMRNEKVIGELTIGISALNVLVTNVILYGMQRYLVYTFGLMYISVYLMIRTKWNKS